MADMRDHDQDHDRDHEEAEEAEEAEDPSKAPPFDYGLAAIRTLGKPVRLTLYRFLATPLVIGLLLAVHPWTYMKSTDSQSPGASSGTTASTYETGSYDNQPADPSTGYSTPTDATATPDAASQTTALNGIIEESAASRQQVTTAVQDAGSCGTDTGLSSDIDALQQAADSRSALADQANSLAMDQVSGGPETARLLGTALTLSATADGDFVTWVTGLADGQCDAGTSLQQSDYLTGVQDSTKALNAKKAFLDAWNPIATQFGLQSRTADEF
jgi:hypothetical protein